MVEKEYDEYLAAEASKLEHVLRESNGELISANRTLKINLSSMAEELVRTKNWMTNTQRAVQKMKEQSAIDHEFATKQKQEIANLKQENKTLEAKVQDLLDDSLFLQALRNAGVDNWDGYSIACQAIRGEDDEDDDED